MPCHVYARKFRNVIIIKNNKTSIVVVDSFVQCGMDTEVYRHKMKENEFRGRGENKTKAKQEQQQSTKD